MSRRPHVALLIETSSIYARRLLSGVSRYLNSHQPWFIFLEEHEWGGEPPRWLMNWRGDGLISRSLTRPASERLRKKLHIPMVNLNDFRRRDFWPPLIRSDNWAIGQLASEHLRQRCFRHFAFCGFDVEWSRQRCESFRTALDSGELFGGAYESPWHSQWSRSWEREQGEIGRWLLSLPKPVGVLACNDARGRHVVEACRRVNLAVPDEVAVLGVDDDALLCELCAPSLSSVIPNPEYLGYEAAALLDRLMVGDRPPQHEGLIAPLGVATRQSTDVLAIDDLDFTSAVRYIREHACQGTNVRQVLEHAPMSRTILERKCRKYLGHSPQAEIRAVQLRRVKQLLAETDLPLERIAALAGYKYAVYMSLAFKRATGLTPGDYRRQAQTPLHEEKPC